MESTSSLFMLMTKSLEMSSEDLNAIGNFSFGSSLSNLTVRTPSLISSAQCSSVIGLYVTSSCLMTSALRFIRRFVAGSLPLFMMLRVWKLIFGGISEKTGRTF